MPEVTINATDEFVKAVVALSVLLKDTDAEILFSGRITPEGFGLDDWSSVRVYPGKHATSKEEKIEAARHCIAALVGYCGKLTKDVDQYGFRMVGMVGSRAIRLMEAGQCKIVGYRKELRRQDKVVQEQVTEVVEQEVDVPITECTSYLKEAAE